jgi:hypothetical protein
MNPPQAPSVARQTRCQPACKPGYVWRSIERVMAIPLGRPLPAASSDQPGREPRDGPGPCGPSPLFGLAPGGACRAADVAARAVRSYRTLSPLPAAEAARRFAFCGAFPEVTLAGRYPAPCLRGARTFLCFRSGHPAGWRERLRALRPGGQMSSPVRHRRDTTQRSAAQGIYARASIRQ